MSDINQIDVLVVSDVEAEKLRLSLALCLGVQGECVHISSSLEDWRSDAIVNVQCYPAKGDFSMQLSIWGASYTRVADVLASFSTMLEVAIFLPSISERSLIGTYFAPNKPPIPMVLEELEGEGETEYRLRRPLL